MDENPNTSSGPKTLIIDIETAPHLADVWGLWQQNVGLSQLRRASYTLCYAYMWWTGDKAKPSDIRFVRDNIAQTAWDLLDEADVVVTYNGKAFDIPTLQKDIVTTISLPPSPFKQIDLYQVVKRQFKFASNKLDHVCEQLGVGRKIKHEGHGLWTKVISGDERAWLAMERYNRRDVRITADLYRVLRPWIPSHPNFPVLAAMTVMGCPTCGSTNFKKDGAAFTSLGAFQKYRCKDCGRWFRATKRSYGGESVGI